MGLTKGVEVKMGVRRGEQEGKKRRRKSGRKKGKEEGWKKVSVMVMMEERGSRTKVFSRCMPFPTALCFVSFVAQRVFLLWERMYERDGAREAAARGGSG